MQVKSSHVINVFRRQGCPHWEQEHGPIVSSRHNFEISEDTMSGRMQREERKLQ